MFAAAVDSATDSAAAPTPWLLIGIYLALSAAVVVFVLWLTSRHDKKRPRIPVKQDTVRPSAERQFRDDLARSMAVERERLIADWTRRGLHGFGESQVVSRKRVIDQEVCETIMDRVTRLFRRYRDGVPRELIRSRLGISNDNFSRHLDFLVMTGKIVRCGQGRKLFRPAGTSTLEPVEIEPAESSSGTTVIMD